MPEQLIDIVRREGVGHLGAYFTPGAYTGRWFETFAGGGDRVETRDRITVDDLYAVEALNVQIPFAVGTISSRLLVSLTYGYDSSPALLPKRSVRRCN